MTTLANHLRPKKENKRFVYPFDLKIGRICRSIFKKKKKKKKKHYLNTEEMQYHSCVCILGHAEPQNWFNPSVGGGCIP